MPQSYPLITCLYVSHCLHHVCLCAYIFVFIHGLLHVLQQVVVGSTLPLVDVDDAVQIGEVAVQIHPLRVAAANKPVLDLSRLGRKQEMVFRHTWEGREARQCPEL